MPSRAKYLLLLALVVGPTTSLAQQQSPHTDIGSHFSTRAVSQADQPPAASTPQRRASGSFPTRQASFEQPASQGGEDGRQAISLTPPGADRSLPLAKPGADGDARRSGSSIATILGSLGIVLGLFLLVVWMLRRAMPRTSHNLPAGMVEVLGRASLTNRQHVHLVRCGNKLLLICILPSGIETLTEITDPLEVDRLAGLCQQSPSNSTTAAFRQVFSDLAAQPAAGGFSGPYESPRASMLRSQSRGSQEGGRA